METTISDYRDDEKSVSRPDIYTEIAEGQTTETYAWFHRNLSRPRVLSGFAPWILAFSALTSPIEYVDFNRESRHSGSSSIVYVFRTRRGRSMTVQESWDQIARVFIEAERARTKQREFESHQFLAMLIDDAS